MAEWQVEFFIIPRRATGAAIATTRESLRTGDWWSGAMLPGDYRDRLSAAGTYDSGGESGVESWGAEDGNRIEIVSEHGHVVRVRARVDVRQLDARFAAALLTFVRVANAALVRGDGSATEPTAGGLGNAIRSSLAWRFARPEVR